MRTRSRAGVLAPSTAAADELGPDLDDALSEAGPGEPHVAARSTHASAPSGRGVAAALSLLLPAVLLGFLTGCGVGAQVRGEPVAVTDALPVPPRPPGSGSGEELVVYLVAGSRLGPVPRLVPDLRPQDAVDQLLAGPTRDEVRSGLRTAISPQHLTVLTGPDDGGTVTITVTRGFTGMGGANQLPAVAQVVWTVTQFPRIEHVRFVFDGVPVAVPTDDGLTDQPVDRADYTSLAPADEPTGTPPTAPAPPHTSPRTPTAGVEEGTAGQSRERGQGRARHRGRRPHPAHRLDDPAPGGP